MTKNKAKFESNSLVYGHKSAVRRSFSAEIRRSLKNTSSSASRSRSLNRSLSSDATTKNIVIIDKKRDSSIVRRNSSRKKKRNNPSAVQAKNKKMSHSDNKSTTLPGGYAKFKSLVDNFEANEDNNVGIKGTKQKLVKTSTTPAKGRRRKLNPRQELLPNSSRNKKSAAQKPKKSYKRKESEFTNKAWLDRLDHWHRKILDAAQAAPGPALNAVASAVSAIERATIDGSDKLLFIETF